MQRKSCTFFQFHSGGVCRGCLAIWTQLRKLSCVSKEVDKRSASIYLSFQKIGFSKQQNFWYFSFLWGDRNIYRRRMARFPVKLLPLVCDVTLLATSGKTDDTLIISGLSKRFEIPCIMLARSARSFNRVARHVTTDGFRFSDLFLLVAWGKLALISLKSWALSFLEAFSPLRMSFFTLLL